MDHPWAIWAIAGAVLIVVELLVGNFYALVLGISAFTGAIAAFALENDLLVMSGLDNSMLIQFGIAFIACCIGLPIARALNVMSQETEIAECE